MGRKSSLVGPRAIRLEPRPSPNETVAEWKARKETIMGGVPGRREIVGRLTERKERELNAANTAEWTLTPRNAASMATPLPLDVALEQLHNPWYILREDFPARPETNRDGSKNPAPVVSIEVLKSYKRTIKLED